MPDSLRIVTSIYNKLGGNKGWDGFDTIRTISNTLGVPVTVYEKVDELPFMTTKATKTLTDCNGQVIELDNTGSCDYAFLYHMYTHYDILDDVTVFTKTNIGDPHSAGCGTLEEIMQFVSESKQWDFSDLGTFPIRGIWNHELEYLNKTYLQPTYEPVDARDPCGGRSSDWFDHIFGSTSEFKTTNDIWGHGPLFAVSKKLILRHPRSVYKYLIESYLSPMYGCHHPCPGYNPTHDLFQRFWRILFTYRADDANVKQNPHHWIEPTHRLKSVE